MSKGFWMPSNAGCMPDGDITIDNSASIESKRIAPWFVDSTEADLFPHKKQAIEVPGIGSFPGIASSSLSSWGNAPTFHSVPGQFTERLFDSETARAVNFDERNISAFGPGNLNIERKAIDDPFLNDSSFGLSMSHTFEDSRSGLNYGGIRKVKVSQVKDSGTVITVPDGPTGVSGDGCEMPMPHEFCKLGNGATTSTGLDYSVREENVMIMSDSFGQEAENFMSMSQPYATKGDHSLSVSVGDNYKDESSTISLVDALSKGDSSLLSVSQSFNKGENNSTISMSQIFISGEDDNILSMGQGYSKENDNNSFLIGNSNPFSKGESNSVSMCHLNSKSSGNSLSLGHCFEKGETNIISFGGFNDINDTKSSGRLLCNYGLLMGQPPLQSLGTLNQKDLVVSDFNALPSTTLVSAPRADSASKRKDDGKSSKKTPSNNFPSNVRSLLSTGILDGVPVKYVAWSREKELRAIIRGSGYLCGCQSCSMNKVINAYEFERHAGCKTKHPNNHIYFENGKTIYGIVQELRGTPQNLLFDVIQTITGSPINQKSFRIWKESFVAATRELQRIYGNVEGKQPT